MSSSTTVDETPNTALAASVMDELHLGANPPEDEYAGDLPPAYNTFEVAYQHWRDADKAKQAMMALDEDPAIATVDTELKKAKQVLKELQATRSDISFLKQSNSLSHLHDVARSCLRHHERSGIRSNLTSASESQNERPTLTTPQLMQMGVRATLQSQKCSKEPMRRR
jgi:hypothetical protein